MSYYSTSIKDTTHYFPQFTTMAAHHHHSYSIHVHIMTKTVHHVLSFLFLMYFTTCCCAYTKTSSRPIISSLPNRILTNNPKKLDINILKNDRRSILLHYSLPKNTEEEGLHVFTAITFQQKKAIRRSCLFMNPKNNYNNNNTNNDDDNSKKEKKSVARAGGRYNRPKENVKKDDKNNAILNVVKKVIPLFIVLSILKSIFGWLFFGNLGRNTNVIYYQSTVYESRTYDENGKMERIRKESVKSNLPSSMIKGYNADDDTKTFDTKFDKQLEEEIQRELQSSFQRNRMVLNGFDYL